MLVPYTNTQFDTVNGSYGSFGGGAVLGFNASQVSGDNLGGYNKAGISGGFFVSKKLNETGELEMRMTYSAKGSRDVPNYEKGKYSAYYLKLNYIEVPILYRYKFKMLWLLAGLSGGYLINMKFVHSLAWDFHLTNIGKLN